MEHLNQQSGLAITLDSDPKPEPSTIEKRALLFQGVREPLVNAIKHAGARRIRVLLRQEHGQVLTVVEDDGKEFAADPAPPQPLTPRELEMLQLIAEGKITKEIAGILCVSDKTVDSYRLPIMAKLNLHCIAELTKYAIREGRAPL